jgi:hypothetical protein
MRKLLSILDTILNIVCYLIITITVFCVCLIPVVVIALVFQIWATCCIIIYPFLKRESGDSFKDLLWFWAGCIPMTLLAIMPVIMEKLGWLENDDYDTYYVG